MCSRQITILESLVYSARLRFGKEVERSIVYAFVQEVPPAALPPPLDSPSLRFACVMQDALAILLAALSLASVLACLPQA